MPELKNGDSEAQQTPYDGIIPTGWLTAYNRTFTDIPYAREVYDELVAVGEEQAAKAFEEMKDTKMAPQFEARYILIDKLIRPTGLKQIMEVAAGLSTRGMEMTSDGSISYVEVELPQMADDKRKVIEALEQKRVFPNRPNLHIENGSATDSDSLAQAARHFNSEEPILVVNEGLLRYLDFDDKTQYAKNVHELLQRFGGAWITSDISLPKVVYKEDELMSERRRKMSEITGVNIAGNLFKDVHDAKQFFEKLGFSVESHSFLEVVDQLVSPERLGLDKDYVEAINQSAVVFVMRPVN